MTWRTTCFVAVMGLSVLACDKGGNDILIPGTPPGSGGGTQNDDSAFAFYKEKVHPALDLTCTWCHAATEAGEVAPGNAPQWLGLDPDTSYANIEAYGTLIAHPKNSLLLLQGEHMGPALQPKQAQVVQEWLLMEVEERGLPTPTDPVEPGGPPVITAEDALAEFAECMTRELWDQNEMYLLAHNQTAGWGPCRGCHNRGYAGAFLDDDETLTYEETKKRPYLLKLVTARIGENGAFEDLIPSERMRFKGSEICTFEDQALCHPKYSLNPNIDANLTNFFTAVHTAWKNGTCGDPPDDGGGGEGGAGGGDAN